MQTASPDYNDCTHPIRLSAYTVSTGLMVSVAGARARAAGGVDIIAVSFFLSRAPFRVLF